MPNPQFTKPWHGVPREEIQWFPTVSADACIGCGTCVTGCSRLVYRYDFEDRKAVVVDPLNCMVGCTTCANTCPTHAISFQPLASVFALEARAEVRHTIEDDLIARKEDLAWRGVVPHADRVVRLEVAAMDRPAPDILLLTLRPRSPSDTLCQFMPGQYLELVAPGASWLPRAYSIGNAPRDDGSVELQVRRVAGGRMTEWLFDGIQTGDTVEARGPLGRFTMRSEPGTPLVFVAGSTGFAPIKAMIEQQLALDPQREMVLFWGAGAREGLYEIEQIAAWSRRDDRFSCILLVERGPLPEAPGDSRIEVGAGSLADAVSRATQDMSGRDAYVAGPPAMMPSVTAALRARGVDQQHVSVDSFGV
jgi:CDP-4-dehydro-6-deoxyglucose reductase